LQIPTVGERWLLVGGGGGGYYFSLWMLWGGKKKKTYRTSGWERKRRGVICTSLTYNEGGGVPETTPGKWGDGGGFGVSLSTSSGGGMCPLAEKTQKEKRKEGVAEVFEEDLSPKKRKKERSS